MHVGSPIVRVSCASRIASSARPWRKLPQPGKRSDKLASCPALEFHLKGPGVLASSHPSISLSEGGRHPRGLPNILMVSSLSSPSNLQIKYPRRPTHHRARIHLPSSRDI